MSEFTLWGLLSKAQDDTQTIDEAIADAITTHNDDPTAHLGTGRSLEQHKTNEILDHLAGSVLSDKQTMSEVSVYTDFGSMIGWSPTGDYDNSFWPGVRLGSNYPSTNGTQLLAQEGFSYMVFNLSKDFMIESSFNFVDVDYATAFIGLSVYPYPVSGNTFIGFKLVNNQLRGMFGKGSTFIQTPVINVNLDELHIYRILYNAFDKTLSFYVDGDLIDTFDLSAESGSSLAQFRISLKESVENGAGSFIFYFKVSRQV